ncbi:MAG: glycosyltransferase family 2 protein [Elusimicrobia bacterium]|nr:glycosyltransferase family 2 protein [Elusimicrobiota bacterium]
MKILFWLCLGLVVYTYFGFFLIVYLLGIVKRKPVRRADIEPAVSVVIAAYNEERVIREKIENTLKLDYPPGKLDVLVVADGSDDLTPVIAGEFEADGVRVLHEPERRGKTVALNRAAPFAKGEVLLFSDANTSYPPETLRRMVRNFNDPLVGGVSGRKVIRRDPEREATKGEERFWSYEGALKVFESQLGSISTADGEIFAMRKGLFEAIPGHVVHDDMYLTLSLIRKGYRVVYEPEAVSEETASKTLVDEFHLKTRYASAGYQIVMAFRGMLFPPANMFAVQFLSHKLLRWLAPFPLLGMLLSSFALDAMAWKVFFVLQVLFYYMAFWGYLLAKNGSRIGILYYPLYFCLGNCAALYGFYKYFTKGQSVLWRKAER